MKRRIGIIVLIIAIVLTAVSLIVSILSNSPNSNETTESTKIQQTQETEETTITEDPVPAESTEPVDQLEAIETPIPEETEEDAWVTQNRVIPDVIPEFDETAYHVLSPQEALEQHGYFYKYEPQYRDTYYWVTPDLLSAANIGNEEYGQWIVENIYPNEINGIEPQEMYTVTFIKDFHISREAFEQACQEFQLWLEDKSKRWAEGDAIFSMERYEMPNADIIYTFDNEIINNYYRRVQ
ncbi:MAG: hypothetical protein KHW87_07840 [Clostridiales bacterium]|nr:hypothetical protein [Clostridiales bacterium]